MDPLTHTLPSGALARLAQQLAAKERASSEALEALRKTTTSGMVGEGVREKDIAIAEVVAIQELSGVIKAGIAEVSDRGFGLERALERASKAADDSAKALAKYTKWLAIATGTLALATIALVIVEAVKRG